MFITITASPRCGWCSRSKSRRATRQHQSLLSGVCSARSTLLRGDVAWGTEKTMAEAEKRDLPNLLKLRQSDRVKELMRRSVGRKSWVPGGWRCCDGRSRKGTESRQERLVGMVVMNPAKPMYEYAVLVTMAPVEDVLSVAQRYRDRADAENIFEEMKNQWGGAVS